MIIRIWLVHLFTIINILLTKADIANNGYCDRDQCSEETTISDSKFLFYDVNPPEGFNLRRDVYMRFAIMMVEARSKGLDWSLVLPPWFYLYHWRSETVNENKPTPWSHFFNINSLKEYSPVIEMHEIFSNLKEYTNTLLLDRLYILENYPNMFEDGEFKDKWEIRDGTNCNYDGLFWGYTNITVKETLCVRFQGKISKLWGLINSHPNDKKVMIAHGEIALHDNYGTKEYWNCRQSMKFNQKLIDTAKKYMKDKLNCIKKCNYASVHWRRQDFSRSRSKDSPSIEGTANQIQNFIKNLNISDIFIATDAVVTEFDELIQKLIILGYRVYFFTPTEAQIREFKDGGIAIIDQIICSYSAFFIGTHESTFTFRIQEEREILGYPSSTTFNRLCPDKGECEKPSKWTIVR